MNDIQRPSLPIGLWTYTREELEHERRHQVRAAVLRALTEAGGIARVAAVAEATGIASATIAQMVLDWPLIRIIRIPRDKTHATWYCLADHPVIVSALGH